MSSLAIPYTRVPASAGLALCGRFQRAECALAEASGVGNPDKVARICRRDHVRPQTKVWRHYGPPAGQLTGAEQRVQGVASTRHLILSSSSRRAHRPAPISPPSLSHAPPPNPTAADRLRLRLWPPTQPLRPRSPPSRGAVCACAQTRCCTKRRPEEDPPPVLHLPDDLPPPRGGNPHTNPHSLPLLHRSHRPNHPSPPHNPTPTASRLPTPSSSPAGPRARSLRSFRVL